MAKATPYYTEDSFKFLKQLARNNNRDWFNQNKARYKEVLKGPSLRLIADLTEPFKEQISPQINPIAKAVGGSLFRIYRDTRFSGDKTPYKTHTGLYFSHIAASKAARGGAAGSGAPGRLDTPGFYLHIEPGDCFIGGGIWHPQTDTTRRIRDYMVSNPASWKAVTRDRKFKAGFSLGGDALVRPPKGYDPSHELIEDLKRKDFIASSALDENLLLQPDLVKQLIKRYARVAPLIDWLCGSLDLEF